MGLLCVPLPRSGSPTVGVSHGRRQRPACRWRSADRCGPWRFSSAGGSTLIASGSYQAEVWDGNQSGGGRLCAGGELPWGGPARTAHTSFPRSEAPEGPPGLSLRAVPVERQVQAFLRGWALDSVSLGRPPRVSGWHRRGRVAGRPGAGAGHRRCGDAPGGLLLLRGVPCPGLGGGVGHLRRAPDLSAEHQGDLGSASYVKENSRELGGLSLAFGATALGQALP